jgi:hypothetical protein
METNDRLTQLEAELKVLKNEVLAVLLDVKEKMLDKENPFSSAPPRIEMPSITIAQAVPAPVETSQRKPSRPEEDMHKQEPVEARSSKTAASRVYERKFENDDNGFCERNYEYCPPAERREQPNLKESTEITRAFRLFEAGQSLIEEPALLKESLSLTCLAGLVSWAESTTSKLGVERTQIILDVSEMMGQLPAELKTILEKMISRDGAKNPEKVYARDYLNALKELARLLGSKNTADFVALHIVSHGLNALARNNQSG